jgi:hypothetical protein
MAGITYEFTQYIAPDGASYTFTAGDRFVLSDTGYGMPDIKYITQQGPFQHGETYLGYRLQPRAIQINLRVNGCSREAYWANRAELLNLLRPNRQSVGQFAPGKLRKILPDGSIRDLDVFIDKGPIFEIRDTGVWDEWGFQETIRFIAPNPTFYDPTTQSVSASYTVSNSLELYNGTTGQSSTGLVFYNPQYSTNVRGMVFTAGLIETTVAAVNAGTWIVYPNFTITGPTTGAQIYNLSTGEIIHVSYSLAAGRTIKISLPYGAKRAYILETGESIISNITSDSDLATFHLEASPGVSGGSNSIRFFCSGASQGVTAISMDWNNRYIAF